MGKTIFVMISVIFFSAYSLIANAMLVPASTITPIAGVTDNPEDCQGIEIAPLGPGIICIDSNVPIVGGFFETIGDAFSGASQMFSGFFQLITFQAGLPVASMVTLLIFVPLTFANAFIIFSTIRGSGS